MNIWVGSGRLTKDPNVKYTQNGKAVCNFTVAVDDGWGEQKKTYFIHVTCWEKLAEACGNNLVKGQKVTVSGKLTQRAYEKDGEKKNIIEVVAREVDFGEKPRGAGASATSGGAFAGTPVPDEDIPF